MLKKEEVYVRVSSEKKARKVKEVLDMFGFEYCDTQFLYDVFYFNDESDFCSCHNKDYPVSMGKTKVSLKELRNILAREKEPQESVVDKAISLLHHGLGLDYSHEVIQGLEKLKNK